MGRLLCFGLRRKAEVVKRLAMPQIKCPGKRLDEQSCGLSTRPDAQHGQTQEMDMGRMGGRESRCTFWILVLDCYEQRNATQRTATSYESIMTGSIRTAGVGYWGEKVVSVICIEKPP